MIGQEELASNLIKVQRTLCAYDGYPFVEAEMPKKAPDTCDCKYGVRNIKCETNGCPEVRLAQAIIEGMTDSEYKRIINRITKKNRYKK